MPNSKIKSLTLTIVIPVYNEEHHIKDCLDSIAAQTVRPNEVIVVDNNSTDNSISIARSYSFVKVIKENNQGRGHARSAGFNVAKSDIIGRIDADSVLMPGWCERVLKQFASNNISGLTGLAHTYTLPRLSPNIYSTLWSRLYYWSTHADIRAYTMWGANMALKRSAWQKVGAKTCLNDNQVHEDIDLSLCLQEAGFKIKQDNGLLVKMKGNSYNYLPKLIHYGALRFRTKKLHIDSLRSKPQILFSFWRVQLFRLVTFFPGIIFIFLSIISFPFDLLMVKLVKKPHWLD